MVGMDRHTFFFSIFASLILGVNAFAGDLTIMDGLGMSRAAKGGVSHADVLVSCEHGSKLPVLKNVDGLKGDLQGVWDAGAKGFRFQNVAPGIWKIEANQEIGRVQILVPK